MPAWCCADLPPDDRVPESSRTNADDRLPLDPLGRVEGGDGIVEGCDVADVCPQSSVPHPVDDLTQLGAIGLDDEVDRQAVRGPRLGRPDDSHQYSSGANQAYRPTLDVASDDIEDQIDAADVFGGDNQSRSVGLIRARGILLEVGCGEPSL